MSKYTEQTGDKELIVKTDPETIGSNLRNAKNDYIVDKTKYNVLEYTKDYMNNLLTVLENVNKNWNTLVDAAILYHDEINYKDEVNYKGVNESIDYTPEPVVTSAVVNTKSDYLNVRSTPYGNILSSIPPGTEVKVLEGDKDGWTKISFQGREAYVCSRYITTNVPLQPISSKVVNVDNLTVRNFVNGQIIDTIPYNTQVEILEDINNGWTKIIYDNRIAFVNSNSLK